jgi:histidinol-phosphate phosphatase family protein
VGLIFLDRDGVLNQMVIDAEHGTIDSPLHPNQVNVFPWVAEALFLLQKGGHGLCIVTNQPAAAKKKTTFLNLEEVQKKVVLEAEKAGAKILSSQICFHRAEDSCDCRKPKTGLLEAAFSLHSNYLKTESWMVGDGVTDIQAGAYFGVKTAYLGPQKLEAIRVFDEKGISPSLWCNNLMEFAQKLLTMK